MSGGDQLRSERPKPDLETAALELSRAWQRVAAHASDIAHARRTLYNAYLTEGFSAAEALELIKQL
jgi:hypothetical protein